MRRKLVVVGVIIALVVAAAVGWRTCGRAAKRSSAGSGGGAATAGPRATERDGRRAAVPLPTPATLSGRVTRASDGAGIAGAIVSIAPAELMSMIVSADAPTLVAVTDASGAWEVERVNPGAVVVAATATGFLPAAGTKLVVAAGERRGGIDLVLAAGGTVVRGTVTDVGGGPIADARVAVVKAGGRELAGRADYVAITKGDGTYEVTLPDGAFNATARHDEYVEVRRELEVAGKPVTLDFELLPGAVIRGQVIAHADGKPVGGALVRASGGRAGGGGNGGEELVRADADGNFTLRGLGSGTIAISAMASGYASINPTEVALGIGEQVEGVRVYVDRAFSISGRVVKQGKPAEGIAGVMLGAVSIATQQFGIVSTPSASDGAFEIVGVRPASYMLFAVGEGSVPDIGKNVDVVDKDVTDVVIELATGVTIAGRVEPPLANVEVSLELAGTIGLANMFEAAKTLLVHGETDAAGAFELRNVPAGSFQIVATARDGQAGKLPAVVAEVDQRGLVVPLQTRASVSGRVVDTNGAAVAGARVTAEPTTTSGVKISFGGRGRAGASSGPDGTFRIVGIEPGKVRVRAMVDRGDRFRVRDKDPSVVELEVVAGKERSGVTLTVEARDGVIRGQVIGHDQQPAGDAWVTAHPVRTADDDKVTTFGNRRGGGGGGGSAPVLTGPDGGFTITTLRRGAYDLVVDGPRGATRGAKPGVKTGDTVTITLAPLGTLAGKATLAGAPVTAYDLACDGPTDKQRYVESVDGTYALPHLAPGAYECTVTSKAGSVTDKLEVPAGSLDHDFALVRWASIRGTVIDVLTKQPIAGVYAFAGAGGASPRNFGELMAGRAPKTDPAGRFRVERVAVGTGELAIMTRDGFMPAAKRAYAITEGQDLDLGTIAIVAPRTGDAGTFGFATNVVGETDLVVASVQPDGPAVRAGIQVGDKLVAINGRPVAELTPAIAKLVLESGMVGVGMVVQLSLDRGGSPVTAALVSVKW